MAEKTEYEVMWGAKVRQPTEMPDDILRDAITTTTDILSKSNATPTEGDINTEAAIQQIKEHMDEKVYEISHSSH